MPQSIPGKPARGTKTGRPIMVLLDLLGRRKSLRLLWELRNEPLTFRELQSNCGDISPTVLNRRLSELRTALIVEHYRDSGYQLSPLGKELFEHLEPLNNWSKKWSRRFDGSAPDVDV